METPNNPAQALSELLSTKTAYKTQEAQAELVGEGRVPWHLAIHDKRSPTAEKLLAWLQSAEQQGIIILLAAHPRHGWVARLVSCETPEG